MFWGTTYYYLFYMRYLLSEYYILAASPWNWIAFLLYVILNTYLHLGVGSDTSTRVNDKLTSFFTLGVSKNLMGSFPFVQFYSLLSTHFYSPFCYSVCGKKGMLLDYYI
ncbi:hypothetical protein FKM82_000011 [Ascaphus truei]